MASDKDMICMSTDVLHHSLLPERYIKNRKGLVGPWDPRFPSKKAIGGPKKSKGQLTIFPGDVRPRRGAGYAHSSFRRSPSRTECQAFKIPLGGSSMNPNNIVARVRIDLGSTRNEPLQVGRTSFVWAAFLRCSLDVLGRSVVEASDERPSSSRGELL